MKIELFGFVFATQTRYYRDIANAKFEALKAAGNRANEMSLVHREHAKQLERVTQSHHKTLRETITYMMRALGGDPDMDRVLAGDPEDHISGESSEVAEDGTLNLSSGASIDFNNLPPLDARLQYQGSEAREMAKPKLSLEEIEVARLERNLNLAELEEELRKVKAQASRQFAKEVGIDLGEGMQAQQTQQSSAREAAIEADIENVLGIWGRLGHAVDENSENGPRSS